MYVLPFYFHHATSQKAKDFSIDKYQFINFSYI